LVMSVTSIFNIQSQQFQNSKEKNKNVGFHMKYNLSFDKHKETQKLKPVLMEYLRKAIFHRMAQQTIYGFI